MLLILELASTLPLLIVNIDNFYPANSIPISASYRMDVSIAPEIDNQYISSKLIGTKYTETSKLVAGSGLEFNLIYTNYKLKIDLSRSLKVETFRNKKNKLTQTNIEKKCRPRLNCGEIVVVLDDKPNDFFMYIKYDNLDFVNYSKLLVLIDGIYYTSTQYTPGR